MTCGHAGTLSDLARFAIRPIAVEAVRHELDRVNALGERAGEAVTPRVGPLPIDHHTLRRARECDSVSCGIFERDLVAVDAVRIKRAARRRRGR